MSQRTLAFFDRAGLQRYETGPISFTLSGEERDAPGSSVELLFNEARASHAARYAAAGLAELPALLHDVEVLELESGGRSGGWQIKTADGTVPIHARAVQIHRPAARAFFRAVPQARTSLQQRLGWSVLLAVLRVPAVARLFAHLRSP